LKINRNRNSEKLKDEENVLEKDIKIYWRNI